MSEITVNDGPGRIYAVTPQGELVFVANVDAKEFIFVPAPLDQEIDPKHP